MPHEQIYSCIAKMGLPIALPKPWLRLRCDLDFFRMPSADVVLETLATQFSTVDLVAAGVTSLIDGARLGLNPALTDSIVWALRDKPGGPPFQLLANMRCLDPKGWSFSAILCDCRTQRLIRRNHDQIIVVVSMSDLAIVRSLGLAAVPADGLLDLTGARWRNFRRLMRADAEESYAPEEGFLGQRPATNVDAARSLTLLDGSLATLEPRESSTRFGPT